MKNSSPCSLILKFIEHVNHGDIEEQSLLVWTGEPDGGLITSRRIYASDAFASWS
jgi:hypothetical protein